MDKAPDQVLRHPPMRESTDRGSHGLSCDVSTLDYINISADIHLLLKQTRKTQLKYLFCVVEGTKGLTKAMEMLSERNKRG
jgi:hypothetical protein